MTSKIEQVIEEMEQYIVEECKPYPLSKSKIIVDRDRIETLISELQMKMPDEIKRYQKIINNKDAILEDAQTKADTILAEAQAKAQELVTEHEVMQRAYALSNETINASNKQAQDILDQATQDANDIRLSAITYTDEMLANIEAIIQETLENAGGKYGIFLEALQSCAGVVTQNRK